MLLNCCYGIVNGWEKKEQVLYKLTYKACKVILNIFFPILYKNKKPMTGRTMQGNEKIVVSFTSFPARIGYVWMTAFTLLNQTVKPDHLILWLSQEQFPTMDAVPDSLKRLQKFGLEIELCGDLRSHKKYFYALQKYPDAVLVTADDDILYPSEWLEKILEKHREYPDVICCNWAHRITFTDGSVNPYEEWEKCISDGANEPSHRTVQIGYAGVLYPPGALDARVLDREAIEQMCLSADDLWLKAMAYMNGTKVICVNNNPTKLFDILAAQKSALYKVNVGQDLNNVALKNILGSFDELKRFE